MIRRLAERGAAGDALTHPDLARTRELGGWEDLARLVASTDAGGTAATGEVRSPVSGWGRAAGGVRSRVRPAHGTPLGPRVVVWRSRPRASPRRPCGSRPTGSSLRVSPTTPCRAGSSWATNAAASCALSAKVSTTPWISCARNPPASSTCAPSPSTPAAATCGWPAPTKVQRDRDPAPHPARLGPPAPGAADWRDGAAGSSGRPGRRRCGARLPARPRRPHSAGQAGRHVHRVRRSGRGRARAQPRARGSNDTVAYVTHAGGIVRVDLGRRRTAEVSSAAELPLTSVERLRAHRDGFVALQRLPGRGPAAAAHRAHPQRPGCSQPPRSSTCASSPVPASCVAVSGDEVALVAGGLDTTGGPNASPSAIGPPAELVVRRFRLR